MVLSPERLPAGPLTYRDYVELPNDGRRYEIIGGELDVTPSPLIRHQAALRNLLLILERYVVDASLGTILLSPVDLILSDTNVVVPDLMFVSRGHESIITARAVEGAPDLVVEIVSPSSERRDRSTKASLYARFTVPCYWLLDPEQRIFEGFVLDGAAYRLAARGRDDEIVKAEPFAEFAISLAAVWAER